MLKRYYRSYRQVYFVIINKIASIDLNLALQMLFKAINNFAGSNRLVLTLLVFSTYFKITKQNKLFLSITKCAIAMKKTIDEVQRFTVFQLINDAFNA